ncbi:hypothetical protein D6833_09010 [Candidatus Parcubacteria bacterium]|nr:MAG: hypothetical protein D6833_09010 [Candidatus Parcubacteria bacterium]
MKNPYLTDFKTARHTLSALLQEPFYVMFPNGLTATSDATTTKQVFCSTLIPFLHEFGYRGNFLYVPSLGEERVIIHADETTGEIVLAEGFSSKVTSGTTFEIHGISVNVKLNALNSAIRQSFPYYYTTDTLDIAIPKYQSVIVDKIPSTWERVIQAYVEPYTRYMHGYFVTDSATTTTITVSGAGWDTDYYEGWEVGVITGDQEGTVVEVASNTADTLTLSTALSSALSVGDEFVLKGPLDGDVSLQSAWNEWYWLTVDTGNNRVYLPNRLLGEYGRTLRLVGIKRPTEFPSNPMDDTATTECNGDYLAYQAANIVNIRYVARSADVTTEPYQWLGRWDAQEAERILHRTAIPLPPQTIFRGHSKGRPSVSPNPFSEW